MQLDDACCRITDRAGIGGNMLLLSVWSWERLPVGRPKSVRFNPWYEDEDDELRRPTWAYKWDVVSEMTNDVNLMYQKYVAEFDTITPEQVTRSLLQSFLMFARKKVTNFVLLPYFIGCMAAIWHR